MLVFRGAIMFEKQVTRIPLIPQLQSVANSFVFWAPRPKKTTWPIVFLTCRTSACGSQKSLWTMISLKWFRWRWRPGERCFGLGWMFGRWTVGMVGGIQVTFPSMLVTQNTSLVATHGRTARPWKHKDFFCLDLISKTCGFAAWKSPTNSCKVGPSSYNLQMGLYFMG